MEIYMYRQYRQDDLDFLLEDLAEEDFFSSSFSIRRQSLRSRIFSVSSGSATVTSSARWDRPGSCSIREYSIGLRKSEPWYLPDQTFGSFRFPIPGSASPTWSGLPTGNYYLEITVGNSNPYCVLLGDITVT